MNILKQLEGKNVVYGKGKKERNRQGDGEKTTNYLPYNSSVLHVAYCYAGWRQGIKLRKDVSELTEELFHFYKRT